MENKEAKKRYAKMLFNFGASQAEIAQKIGTTPATISNWAKEDDWKQKTETTRRKEITSSLLDKIKKLIDEEELTKAIKLSAIYKQLRGAESEENTSTLKALVEFAQIYKSKEEATIVANITKDFIQNIAESETTL